MTPVDSANTCYISQELNVDRELGGIETLQRKAVEYHSVDCPFLMPLDAFFVTVFIATIFMSHLKYNKLRLYI